VEGDGCGRSAAVERTSGMFAHLAPGASLADAPTGERKFAPRNRLTISVYIL